jgi:nitroreductase/NAD-dependent dihydropyrimidine dehydrogenase PreA subunit
MFAKRREAMALIEVDAAKCRKDGLCVAVCPSKVLTADSQGGPVLTDPDLCNDCGHCLAVCPHGALRHERIPATVAPRIRQWPSPEAVDGLLLGRRSIRCYADKPVSRELLSDLLEVASHAPTASNAQEIRWIVTDDPARVRELAGLTVAWFARQPTIRPVHKKYLALWDQGLDTFLRGAPALALIHTENGFAFGAADCGIALTFLELAAVSRGLGTCWAGLLTMAAAGDATLHQALGLPEGHTLHGGLMLGYPALRYAGVPPRNPAVVRWL